MPYLQKACPVVLRRTQYGVDILAFRHPTAGTQLVKGSVEGGEDPGRAALRELCEESGVCDAKIESFLGTVHMGELDQEWHLFLCSTDTLPDAWHHFTED